ncbi:hypothetical protein M433DRAFT_130717 [Acidomyces richmondensis BFW]|nr:MAG: hypothetical protein FE78DRAFT_78509 [Acidomyces sp. 'richmondensis']KYG50070.1 hypothetical protein M433DRAFT_130717 [Acidomyces richmondensis BFW]
MAGVNAGELAASISNYLATRHVPPTQTWMQSFMPSIRTTTPLVSLQKTALFRILSADLQTSIQKCPGPCFPPHIPDPNVKERLVDGPVTVQVLDVEDIGRSRWSQVEAIEAQECGETTRGREIIRLEPDESDPARTTQSQQSRSNGPHKLVLQDANGTKVYAMELTPIYGIDIHMAIGTKIVLRDCIVARGLVLLEPRNAEILGGRVDAWDKKWKEERKQKLKEKAGVRDGG